MFGRLKSVYVREALDLQSCNESLNSCLVLHFDYHSIVAYDSMAISSCSRCCFVVTVLKSILFDLVSYLAIS